MPNLQRGEGHASILLTFLCNFAILATQRGAMAQRSPLNTPLVRCFPSVLCLPSASKVFGIKIWFWCVRRSSQARSQDLEKGGAILKEWEVCKRPRLKFSLTLNQFQTVCQNLRRNVWKRSKIQTFFPPKIRWSPKKKKKKKKKKVFAEV